MAVKKDKALTPMMQQYFRIKTEVPQGAFVMFRLGDFYELFGEDAVKAAPAEKLRLCFNTGSTPCIIKPENEADDSFLYMILPVRLRAGD